MVLNRANQGHEDKSPRELHERLFCYSEAVRELDKSFGNPLIACDDANILAVLALASTGQMSENPPGKSPARGPLTAMQGLNVYRGMSNFSSNLVRGLLRMVSMRGGLRTLGLLGLAAQISYGGILSASQKVARPALPYISFNLNVEKQLGAVWHQRQHDRPLTSLGDGFAFLYQLLPPEEADRLSPVLENIGAYVVAVHDYVNCTTRAFTLGALADARNFVQHSLLSLTIRDDEHPSPLYELCHLAAAIYSLLVLFPLPASTAPMNWLGLCVKSAYVLLRRR